MNKVDISPSFGMREMNRRKKKGYLRVFFFTLNNRFKRYSKYSIVWKFSRNK